MPVGSSNTSRSTPSSGGGGGGRSSRTTRGSAQPSSGGGRRVSIAEKFINDLLAPPENPLGDKVPEAPDVAGTQGPLGEDVVQAERDRAEGQFEAETADKAEADNLADEVRSSQDETNARFDELSGNIEEDRARIEADLQRQRDIVQEIPDVINSEFERLRDEFGNQADASFDRIDSQREAALGDVMQGREAAMEAAVQGIQGNVNTQIAQINSNPNLSAAQKQNMIAQIKLQGATSLGATIGATQLQFNTLSADVSTKFGAITGQLEGTILQTSGQLMGMQGTAFANAQVAVGQMTNQLLEIDANSSVAFSNSQSQLLANRTQAEMASNDILLRLLPEQSTPYLDLTGAASAAYQIGHDIMMSQFAMDLQSFGTEVQVAMMQSLQGSPLSNLFDGAMAGLSGGLPGVILGAFGGVVGSGGGQGV